MDGGGLRFDRLLNDRGPLLEHLLGRARLSELRFGAAPKFRQLVVEELHSALLALLVLGIERIEEGLQHRVALWERRLVRGGDVLLTRRAASAHLVLC